MISLLNPSPDESNYYLYNCGEMICQEIVSFINEQYPLIGKLALCTSVDSGHYGFPNLGERIGEYTNLQITNDILGNWPTYSGYFDEWFIFDNNVPIIVESVGLCNWTSTTINDYKNLKECVPANCQMDLCLANHNPILVLGCNKTDSYIFSKIKIKPR
jgi:hypothetical protein